MSVPAAVGAISGRSPPLGVCGGSSAPTDRRAVRRHAKALVSPCGGLQPAGRIGECSAISTGERPRADHCRLAARNLALSIAEETFQREVLDGPWQTEPHARQRCVENVEVDADDYPGGDPQNGQ